MSTRGCHELFIIFMQYILRCLPLISVIVQVTQLMPKHRRTVMDCQRRDGHARELRHADGCVLKSTGSRDKFKQFYFLYKCKYNNNTRVCHKRIGEKALHDVGHTQTEKLNQTTHKIIFYTHVNRMSFRPLTLPTGRQYVGKWVITKPLTK